MHFVNIVHYLIMKRHIEKILRMKEYWTEANDRAVLYRMDWCFHELLYEGGIFTLYVEIWRMESRDPRTDFTFYSYNEINGHSRDRLEGVLQKRLRSYFGRRFFIIKFVNKINEPRRKARVDYFED